MKKANATKVLSVIWIVLLLLITMPGMAMAAPAATETIPNGDYTIEGNGVYQLAEGYSGTITIASGVTEVTVTDAVYKASHTATSITIAGGRSEALAITIEDIDIAAPIGTAGINLSNLVSNENRLYISGINSVTGGTNNEFTDGMPGIYVPDGVALIIDEAPNSEGAQLTANGGEFGAGIGGGIGEAGGTITISGGTVTANGGGYAAAIGSGTGGSGGTITISGGIVVANGSYSAAAIGSGGGAGGTITISGGTVTANGTDYGTGIGSGEGGTGSTITISGGTVTATGGGAGAGIGGSNNGEGGTITISGGTVTAIGGGGAAGIGGGQDGSGGIITISEGTVEAAGGGDGAGIGGGYNGAGGTITISEGTVTAIGGESGAGIGGGRFGDSGTITISGGTVTATGGDFAVGIGGSFWEDRGTITISGGTVTANGGWFEAGIGGGYSEYSGTIMISGGTVTATGGESGAGIGGGESGSGRNVIITGASIVYATGDIENGAEHIGMGTGGTGSGTLKDDSDADLSYLRFSTAGIAGVKIELEGIDREYMTNDQGIYGIFVPRSGSVTYTVSKAGYETVQGTQDVSLMNHEFNIPMVVDNTPPTVSDGNISISNTTQTGTILTWNKASDLGTADAALRYSVYISAADNLNTVEDIEANGTVKQNYIADIDTLNITGLQPGSTYYLNVIVMDEAGNKTCYNMASVTTRAVSSGSGGSSNRGNNITTTTANTNEVTIPVNTLAGDAGKTTEIKTELATVSLPSNMLTGEAVGNTSFATLNVSRADTAKLPAEVQAQVGNRPVIELTLRLDGKTISWNNPDAPVTVSIPYKPTAEELANPENITVWYIDGAGNAVSVPSGRYDPVTGTVSFTTTHFSKYAVVYVKKSFNDLNSHVWAQKQIEVLASKGILKGLTETEYAPQTNITRADFLYFLVRTLGVDAKADGSFDDISSDAYYYKEIGIAKALGITSGIGNNKFSPDASLTRQDMMVLTDRALRILKKLEVQGMASDLNKFSDKSLVAAYAVNGAASVVKEGLIAGSGDKVNPLGNTTRAEAAVFLYRVYNKY